MAQEILDSDLGGGIPDGARSGITVVVVGDANCCPAYPDGFVLGISPR